MQKSNNSLLDITRKSLTDEQIKDCFVRFKEAVKDFTKLPQVELVDKFGTENRITLKFISLSNSHTVNSPSIVLQVTESCQNMETVKSVLAEAHNCGMCRNGSKATFNNKNVHQFEKVLENIQSLFETNYEESIKEDKVQVDFNKVIEEAKTMLAYHVVKKSQYQSDEYLGKIRGELEETRDDKTFRIKLEGLNIDQIRELSKVITNL